MCPDAHSAVPAKRTWSGTGRRLPFFQVLRCATNGLAAAFLVLPAVSACAGRAADYLGKQEDWFRAAEGLRVMTNVLSWQTAHGSWPKNVDTTVAAVPAEREKLQGTFDNGATTGELRLLARAFQATQKPEYEQAFLNGFDHVLQAQYTNGGWPQFFPLSKQYPRHITFNDDTMVRLLKFVREVAKDPLYAFVDARRRAAAQAGFERGIACILKCQILVNGRLTAWCAQHDELTFQPCTGRSYELPSISGAESAGILELLMSLEQPSSEIIRAVHAGAAWFARARITGIRVVKVDGDKRVIADPNGPALWARFYDLENGRPFFSDRDGVKKYDLSAIGSERRNGYAWYGEWGTKVAQRYQEWRKTVE